MALTVANITPIVSGRRRIMYAEITMDNSYNTGGEALAASDVGLQVIDYVFLSSGDDGAVLQWDQANKKIKAFVTNTSTNTNTTLASSALKEVASTTDLSGVVFAIQAVGI